MMTKEKIYRNYKYHNHIFGVTCILISLIHQQQPKEHPHNIEKKWYY